MIKLIHLSGSKTDLVAVGRITGSGSSNQLFLRQFAFQSLADAAQRIGSAGNAHGRIYIAAAGQRITDRAADAGGGTAEGFDLRRVVVGFVLKEKEPVLSFSVDVYLDLYRAGIDLFGLIQFVQHANGFQITRTDGAHVHQGNGLRAMELFTGTNVLIISVLKLGVIGLDRINHCVESRVAAVVRPVCINDTDLGDAGIPVLRPEVVPAADQIAQIHGQSFFPSKSCQLVFIIGSEAV